MTTSAEGGLGPAQHNKIAPLEKLADHLGEHMGIVQTVPSSQKCQECGREVFAQAVILIVEGARDPSGHSEIVDQLTALRDSKNRKNRERFYDLEERFEQLAAYGKLEEPRQMRQLRGNLWEIKTGRDRVPFYFKMASASHQQAARLTHLFEKATGKTADGKTPRQHLDHGEWVMNGDRNND